MKRKIQIIDAAPPKSKSLQMREIARQIAGKEKAAFFETEGDFRFFLQIVRKMGLKPRSQKLASGGWKVWVVL